MCWSFAQRSYGVREINVRSTFKKCRIDYAWMSRLYSQCPGGTFYDVKLTVVYVILGHIRSRSDGTGHTSELGSRGERLMLFTRKAIFLCNRDQEVGFRTWKLTRNTLERNWGRGWNRI